MKQIIGPRRVISKINKEEYPDLSFPTEDPIKNQANIKAATELIAIIDNDFFTKGKSLGTKVEIMNNPKKVSKALFVLSDGTFTNYDVNDLIKKIDEPLPDWNTYVKDTSDELKKTQEQIKVEGKKIGGVSDGVRATDSKPV